MLRSRLVLACLAVVAVLLVACGEDSEPAANAPRSKIAFVSDRDGYMRIYVMDPDGTNQLAITDPPYGDDRSPAWSPDGTQIAFSSDRSGDEDIYVMDSDGGNPRNISNRPDTTDTDPAWAPDGTRIAFVSVVDGVETIVVMGADGQRQIRLSVENNTGRTPHWAPDGTGFIYETAYGAGLDSALYIATPNGAAHEPFGDIPGPNRSPAWSRDGSALATTADAWDRGPRRSIVVTDPDGENLRVVSSNLRGSDDMPTWSPDGRRIAYTANDTSATNTHLERGAGARADILVVSLDDMSVTNLTNDRAYDGMPDWSP